MSDILKPSNQFVGKVISIGTYGANNKPMFTIELIRRVVNGEIDITKILDEPVVAVNATIPQVNIVPNIPISVNIGDYISATCQRSCGIDTYIVNTITKHPLGRKLAEGIMPTGQVSVQNKPAAENIKREHIESSPVRLPSERPDAPKDTDAARNFVLSVPLALDTSDIPEDQLLIIGYTKISVPVTAIQVQEENGLNANELLRTHGSIKALDKHVKKQIVITFTIDTLDNFNKIVVPLIEQFHRTSFLPVVNSYLNTAWDIDAITLRDFSVTTVEGTPGAFAITIVCEPFAWHIYLPSNPGFSSSFCWPLFKLWCEYRSTCSPLNKLDGALSVYLPDIEILNEKTKAREVESIVTATEQDAIVLQNASTCSDYPDLGIYYYTDSGMKYSLFPLKSPNSALILLKKSLEDTSVKIYTSVKKCANSNASYKKTPATKPNIKKYIEAIEAFQKDNNQAHLTEWYGDGSKWIYELKENSPLWKQLKASADTIVSPLIVEDELKQFDFSDFVFTGISLQFSPKIAEHHPNDVPHPVHQHLGSGDSFMSVQGVITSDNGVEVFRSVMENLRELGRRFKPRPNERDYAGFIKIENDLINALGVQNAIPLSFNVSMVPGFPHLFNFQIDLIEYDIEQKQREQYKRLESFILAGGEESQQFVTDAPQIEVPEDNILYETIRDNKVHRIMRSSAYKMMLKTLDLYPDMKLPSKEELGSWILGLQNAVNSKNLDPLFASALSIIDPEDAETLTRIKSLRGVTSPVLGWEDPDFYCPPDDSVSSERTTLLNETIHNISNRFRDRFGASYYVDVGKRFDEGSPLNTDENTNALNDQQKKLSSVTPTNQVSTVTTPTTTNANIIAMRKKTDEILSKIKIRVPNYTEEIKAANDTFKKYATVLSNECKRQGVPISFAIGVLYQESSGNPNSVTKVEIKDKNGKVIRTINYCGLFQLSLENDITDNSVVGIYNNAQTGINSSNVTEANLKDANFNIKVGVARLGAYLRSYDNDTVLAYLAHKNGESGLSRKIENNSLSNTDKIAVSRVEAIREGLAKLDPLYARMEYIGSQNVSNIGISYLGDPLAAQLDNYSQYQTEKAAGKIEETPSGEDITNEAKGNEDFRSHFYDFESRPDIDRLVQAFPTFMVAVIDGGRYLGVEKLWDHFYGAFGINSIDVVQSRKDPVDVATVVFSNVYGRLSSIPGYIKALKETDTRQQYSLEAFASGVRQWLTAVPSEDLKDRWNKFFKTLLIKPGARLHIRLGYGNSADKLPVKFNGTISEVPVADNYVQVVAVGDGAQLVKNIPPNSLHLKESTVSGESAFNNTGFLNTPKEPRNIITEFFEGKREKLAALSAGRWGSDNFYGITQFGSLDYSNIINSSIGITYDLGEVGVNIYTSKSNKDPENVYPAWRNWVTINGTLAHLQGQTLIGVEVDNATPWNVMEVCRKAIPDYILAVRPFEFRSTLFYGKGSWPFYYQYKDDISSPNYSGKIAQLPYSLQGDPNNVLKSIIDIGAPITALAAGAAVGNPALGIVTEKFIPYAVKAFQAGILDIALSTTIQSHITSKNPKNTPKSYSELMDHKAFSQFHIISSYDNLLDTNIIADEGPVYTGAQAKFTYGFFGAGVKDGDLMQVDSDIFPEQQKTKIIPSGILSGPLQGFGGLQRVAEFFSGNNLNFVATAANTVSVMTLRDDVADMYQGYNIIRGDPYINPWDFCYLNDVTRLMTGVYQVKETVNHFSIEHGYTTAVSPDCSVWCASTSGPSFLAGLFRIAKMWTSGRVMRMVYNMEIARGLRGAIAMRKSLLKDLALTRADTAIISKQIIPITDKKLASRWASTYFDELESFKKVQGMVGKKLAPGSVTQLATTANNRVLAELKKELEVAKLNLERAKTARSSSSVGGYWLRSSPGETVKATARYVKNVETIEKRIQDIEKLNPAEVAERISNYEATKYRAATAAKQLFSRNSDTTKALKKYKAAISRYRQARADAKKASDALNALRTQLEAARSTIPASATQLEEARKNLETIKSLGSKSSLGGGWLQSSVAETIESTNKYLETIKAAEEAVKATIKAAEADMLKAEASAEDAVKQLRRVVKQARAELDLAKGPAHSALKSAKWLKKYGRGGTMAAEAMAGPPGWAKLVLDAALMILAGSIGNMVGRWLSSRQTLIIAPLTINGNEFSAGINGHAGAVVGDSAGMMDHILGSIMSSEYASKHYGVPGLIIPMLTDFLLPGADSGWDPEAGKVYGNTTYNSKEFDEYVKRLHDITTQKLPSAEQVYNTSHEDLTKLPSGYNRQKIVDAALRRLTDGTVYQWNGKLGKNLDCSGFVAAVFKECLGSYAKGLSADGPYTRGSANQSRVSIFSNEPLIKNPANLLPGDRVYFGTSQATIHHTGIYIGDGKCISAANKKDGIKISKLSDYKDFFGGRR